MGFDARWGVLGAADVGAPHIRERIWLMAYTKHMRCNQRKPGNTRAEIKAWSEYRLESHRRARILPTPGVCRMADGVAARVDRLKAIGNGQVPAVAATAWRILGELA
jgi:DNA (cytosine-5)-methyltransferase 1